MVEDLFVKPAHRGRGLVGALLAHVAWVVVDRGCGRMEWSVLRSNASAIRFYRGGGARPLADWIVYRLTGQPLSPPAAGAPYTGVQLG